ncbi:MAG: permease-like cell division protein FtsX [Erysipelotrichaceae bacterium]|nr:permease-like cell division protein FtsX [Erysipelotrichaceae bacterium]
MNRIFRVFREGFLGVKRHGAMSFSSASAVTMTLLIIGAFVLLNANLQHIVTNVEGNVQIHAKVETRVDDSGIKDLQKKIEAIPGVREVVFSSKEQELESFIASYGEQGDLFRMYVGENNPLRNAFLIETNTGDDIEPVATQVRALDGIENVNYGGEGTITLVNSMEKIRRISYIVVGALSVIAVLLISNTINTTINARKDEIFIMRTVGASNGFIRWPFIIEGIIIGILGSIIPIGVLCGGYYYLYQLLGGNLFSTLFSLINPKDIILYLGLGLLASGILVGSIGSFISVSKKLWWKR